MAADSHGGAAGLVVRREEDADAGRCSHGGVSRVGEKEQGSGHSSSGQAGRARGARVRWAWPTVRDWRPGDVQEQAQRGKRRPKASPALQGFVRRGLGKPAWGKTRRPPATAVMGSGRSGERRGSVKAVGEEDEDASRRIRR